MPQTLTPEWVQELGDDAPEHHARLLHTLGNLTLTGYNPDLSNRLYVEKRELLQLIARQVQDGIFRTRAMFGRVPNFLYTRLQEQDETDFANIAEDRRTRLTN